jgi:hypothetical protein
MSQLFLALLRQLGLYRSPTTRAFPGVDTVAYAPPPQITPDEAEEPPPPRRAQRNKVKLTVTHTELMEFIQAHSAELIGPGLIASKVELIYTDEDGEELDVDDDTVELLFIVDRNQLMAAAPGEPPTASPITPGSRRPVMPLDTPNDPRDS